MNELARLLDTKQVAARFTPFTPDYDQTRAIVISLANTPELRNCEPLTILGAALTAAQLNLPLTKQQGCAYILPYGKQAQFQIGYKGWIQIALSTHLFAKLNACAVYAGQLKKYDPLTEEYEFDWTVAPSGQPVGYAAYFKLIDGFSKMLYMSREAIDAHAKRYSRTYARGGGVWSTNFDDMAKKTVLSKILRTYAPQTRETMTAYERDHAVTRIDAETGEITSSYNDNPQTIVAAEGVALGDMTEGTSDE